jgi:hypothetical protein
MNVTRLLDPAVAAVDRAVEVVHYDDLEPADLSAVIAGLRELFWHTTILTSVLVHAYDTAHTIGQDNGGDPAVALTTIVAGLHIVADLLASVDAALNETHCHAAHLHRRP